jgi:hypothetical protein
MRIWILAIAMLAVGCSASPSNSTTRRFDISLDQADIKLRQLYPASLSGPTTIKRDELSHDQQELIVVQETEHPRKTAITLVGQGNACDVSVQSSVSKKTVLLPSRDMEYEQAEMNRIAEALNKK